MDCRRPSRPIPRIRNAGQALVEFVMVVFPLILLIFATVYVGAGMYAAATASSAVKQPNFQAMTLADNPGATQGQALGFITAADPGQYGATTGAAVDGANILNPANVTALMCATKGYTPPFGFLPQLNSTACEGIKANLLAANGGASIGLTAVPAMNQNPYSVHPAQAGGLVNPADYGLDASLLPNRLQLVNDTCAPAGTAGLTDADALAPSTDYELEEYLGPGDSPSGSRYVSNDMYRLLAGGAVPDCDNAATDIATRCGDAQKDQYKEDNPTWADPPVDAPIDWVAPTEPPDFEVDETGKNSCLADQLFACKYHRVTRYIQALVDAMESSSQFCTATQGNNGDVTLPAANPSY